MTFCKAANLNTTQKENHEVNINDVANALSKAAQSIK